MSRIISQWPITITPNEVIVHVPAKIKNSGGVFDVSGKWLKKWGELLTKWFLEYVTTSELNKSTFCFVLNTLGEKKFTQQLDNLFDQSCQGKTWISNEQWEHFICEECSFNSDLLNSLFSLANVEIPTLTIIIYQKGSVEAITQFANTVEASIAKDLAIPHHENILFVGYFIDNEFIIPNVYINLPIFQQTLLAVSSTYNLYLEWLNQSI